MQLSSPPQQQLSEGQGQGRGDRGYDRGDRGYGKGDRGYDKGDRGYDRGDRGYDRGDERGDRRERVNDTGYDQDMNNLVPSTPYQQSQPFSQQSPQPLSSQPVPPSAPLSAPVSASEPVSASSASAPVSASSASPPPPLPGSGSWLGSRTQGNGTSGMSAMNNRGSGQSILSAFRLKLTRGDVAEVRDTTALMISIFVRVLRVMILWIILFFVDRAYQAIYVEEVLSQPIDVTAPTPATSLSPRLWTMMPLVLGIESVVLLIVVLGLLALKTRFKRVNNTFVIDAPLLRRLLREYLASVAVLAPLGALVGHTMQSCKEMRYRDDGLRGIRALAVLLLIMSIVIIAAPLTS